MKERILATALSAALLFTGTLRAANADNWVLNDTLHPHGKARSTAALHVDARSCGADHDGSFYQSELPSMQQCLASHGWKLSRVTGRRSPRTAQAGLSDYSPIEYPSGNDTSQAQFDQTQQEINQTVINTEQMNNDMMMQQQIQQMNQ